MLSGNKQERLQSCEAHLKVFRNELKTDDEWQMFVLIYLASAFKYWGLEEKKQVHQRTGCGLGILYPCWSKLEIFLPSIREIECVAISQWINACTYTSLLEISVPYNNAWRAVHFTGRQP